MSTTAGRLLSIYKVRLKMQEEGITAPTEEVKAFTRSLVEVLSNMPPDTILHIVDHQLKDANGTCIASFPHNEPMY